MHWASPPPAAEPLMLKVGPPSAADGAGHTLPEFTQSFNQSDHRGCLSLPQGCRGDGSDIDVFRGGIALHAREGLAVVHLGQLRPHGDQLVRLEAQFLGQQPDRLHDFFGGLGNLPILHRQGIEHRTLRDAAGASRTGFTSGAALRRIRFAAEVYYTRSTFAGWFYILEILCAL
jgi:hypothetical protein